MGGSVDTQHRFSVRKVPHRDGTISHWIFSPEGDLHRPSLEVLKAHRAGTQQTYAYSLVDHLNWLRANGKSESSVTLPELQRYMKALMGQLDGIAGVPWRRPEQGPLSAAAAANVAMAVKAYYAALPASTSTLGQLQRDLSPAGKQVGRGGRHRVVESNPLSPRKSARRPRFLPDEFVEQLYEPGVLHTARDVMIVTWLHDGGFRVGGLCGLRFCDLHLVRDHPCGQRREPHVHVIGRDDNPNQARAKAYSDGSVSSDGYVLDGVIRAVSNDMISTFYAYVLDEYSRVQHLVDHEQVIVHLGGKTPGRALSTNAVRKMLRSACDRAGIAGRITPHAFRHKAVADFYAESDFNAEMVAQEHGWASPSMVTEVYGTSANRHALKHLRRAWERTARPPAEDYLAPEDQEATTTKGARDVR